MGRPIPEIQPIKVPEVKDGEDKNKGNRNNNRKPGAKKGAAPKITFVGGTKLTTAGIVKSDSSEGTTASGQTSKEDETMETATETDGTGKLFNSLQYSKLQILTVCCF